MTHSIESTLLSQSEPLRALARRLVGDEHSADDLMQEAWLRSAAVPEDVRSHSPRAWAARVLTNLASDRRRSKASRAYHEQLATRAEQLQATDELVAEGEVWSRVIDAVAGLEPTYKRVIVMRFYQSLPPRQIAKELGVPVATVKSQLNRALQQLRVRLDELSGDRRDHWAGVLALGVGRRPLLSAAVGWGVLLVAALLIVGAGLWSGWLGGRSSGPNLKAEFVRAEGGRGNEASASSANDSELPGNQTSVGADRQGIEEGEALPAVLPVGHEFQLDLQICLISDVSMPGDEVFMGPSGQPMNAVGKTDERGRLRCKWTSEQGTERLVLGVRRRGRWLTGLRQIDLKAGVPFALRLSVQHFYRPQFFDLHASPPAWKDAPELRFMKDPVALAPALVLDEEQNRIAFQRGEPDPALLEATRAKAARPLMQRAQSADPAGGWSAGGHLDGCVADLHFRKMIDFEGTIYQADGRPAEGAMLATGDGGSQPLMDEGEFGMGFWPPRDRVLWAGGGVYGQATKSFSIAPDSEPHRIEWNPVLERGNEVLGRVRKSGEMFPGPWIVEVEIDGARSVHGDRYNFPSGQFTFPNQPKGAGNLLLSTPDSWPFAVQVQALISPSLVNDIELQPGALACLPVEVLVLDSLGVPRAAEVQLWQASSGRGVWLEYDPVTRKHRRAAIPPGSYKLKVGDGELGYTEYGPFFADGVEALSIGPLQ